MKPKKQDSTVKQREQAIWNVLKYIVNCIAITIVVLLLVAIMVAVIYLGCVSVDDYINSKFEKYPIQQTVFVQKDDIQESENRLIITVPKVNWRDMY